MRQIAYIDELGNLLYDDVVDDFTPLPPNAVEGRVPDGFHEPMWAGEWVEGLANEEVLNSEKMNRAGTIKEEAERRFLVEPDGSPIDSSSKAMQMDMSLFQLVTEGSLPPEASNANELKAMYRAMRTYLEEIEAYPYDSTRTLNEQVVEIKSIGADFAP